MSKTLSPNPTFPTEADIPSLKNLWIDTFDDNAIVLSLFFETLFKPENAIVIKDFDIPVSMLYLLPITWRTNQNLLNGYYIYAVGTNQSHRGQGYASRMLAFANEVAKERGKDFTCLVPTNEGLFALYEKAGFTRHITSIKSELSRADLSSYLSSSKGSASHSTLSDISPLRAALTDNLPSVFLFGEEHLKFASFIDNQYGRQVLRVGQTGYICCDPEQGVLHVKEYCLGKETFFDFVDTLLKNYPKIERFLITHTADDPYLYSTKKSVPFALLHPINDEALAPLFAGDRLVKPAYLSQVLD